MNSYKSLKVGLIVDSPDVSPCDYDLIQWAQNQSNVTISHLIVQQLPSLETGGSRISRQLRMLRDKGLIGYVKARLWRRIYLYEKKILARTAYSGDGVGNEASEIVDGMIQVTPKISKSGLIFRYPTSDLDKIRGEKFDVLIRCGSGILRGDILKAARFGVLSFHHADNRINRGLPPGFWEVYLRQPQTGFIIQQLTDELDGGNVLCRGAFLTEKHWGVNYASLCRKSNYYFKRLLGEIAKKDAIEPIEEKSPYYNELYQEPKLFVQIHYLYRSFVNRLRTKIRYKGLGRRQRWGVAFQRTHWRDLVMRRANKIPNPPGRFNADPFVYSKDGRDYCFVEDYEYATNRACISVYELSGRDSSFVGEVIREPFHMSFPYLFEFDSNLYMVPETSENRDIRIYKCIEFPLKWELASVAMRGVSAADTMIFHKSGYWWLLTNIDPLELGDHCSELTIFYSTDPLGGEWIPHEKNPIYVDPGVARNGGILFDRDRVFRVTQVPGFCQYGAESQIFEIKDISPEEYEETFVSSIKPNFFKDLLGTHHLHGNESVTVFDYLKEERIAVSPTNKNSEGL